MMINRLTSTTSLALLLTSLMLQACGLKGDLYLEPAAAETPTTEAAGTSENTPTAELAESEDDTDTDTDTDTSQLTSPADDVTPE
jgi:predicted small lipoprotein YifL